MSSDCECLDRAMFLAAESYSGSAFGKEFFDDICAAVLAVSRGYEAAGGDGNGILAAMAV